MFRHILVPIDQHPGCPVAVRHALDLTRAIGGRVTLLHVLENDQDGARRAAQIHLSTLARGARRPPEQVVLPVLDHDVVGAVSAFARQHRADLIVLGVRGHGGLEDEAIGALAVNLASASGRPVQVTEGQSRATQTRWHTWTAGTAASEA